MAYFRSYYLRFYIFMAEPLALFFTDPRTLAFMHGAKDTELDMAMHSAAYIFTQTPAADQAAIDYIRKEWANRNDFLRVWGEANKALGPNVTIPKGLRREHLMAIHAYTQNSTLHSEFNSAVSQCGGSDTIYQSKFHFKSFHYLLSVALSKLKTKRRKTFRGANELFNAKKGVKVRLGIFASTSLNQGIAKRFLKSKSNTLFEIETKLGVLISNFSELEYEEEVLIPPIEVFKVKRKPVEEKDGQRGWRNIKLVVAGCQGITVTVQTENGAFEVRRGKGKCPRHCKCLLA
ncbi:GPI-linked NAD(P)(+)--arginine ADP-ribosyltransferase 1-like [Carcharodon carcharias]|uniref:GPI-linked NAD(P)(+)--arginine ADP-ribosyltransferase 1-like n=1 Tax=Carcharodon carcharias TaxID=13397 RepID=UPI001B7E3638|nr:GPI-linked NAD(P)(+)--arginine ADP-ribosyltransferase 1-like [Carcharodon carcharias]